jgi:hypothetical protein
VSGAAPGTPAPPPSLMARRRGNAKACGLPGREGAVMDPERQPTKVTRTFSLLLPPSTGKLSSLGLRRDERRSSLAALERSGTAAER